MHDEDSEGGCSGDCRLPANRRRFLQDTFVAAATALIGLGVRSSSALAMPLDLIEGVRRSNDLISYSVPTADGAQVDMKNAVILVRWQGSVYAFNLSCPHQNTALKWDERDKGFNCPKHHSRFSATGEYVADSGRATRNMDRLAIVRDGNTVRVDVDKVYEADTDTTAWKSAFVAV